jgi:hypothetical protein
MVNKNEVREKLALQNGQKYSNQMKTTAAGTCGARL